MTKNPLERQKKLRTEIRTEPESPYKQLYGIRDNPFPSMALFRSSADDPRQNGAIYDTEFRKEEEKLFFERFVLPPTGDNPLELGFIRLDQQAGGRGNGKSAFLHHLMDRINNASWPDWPEDPEDPRLSAVAVHLLPEPKKQNNFFQLVRLIFETLSRRGRYPGSLSEKIDGDVRAALLLDLLSEEQVEALSTRPAHELRQDLESTPRFRELLKKHAITIDDVTRKAEEKLHEVSALALGNDFVRAFLTEGASITDAWSLWRQNGWAASDYRWSRTGADWLVNGLVPILVLGGYQRLYVLLDEFEKIYLYQTVRKREEFLDSLRQVFYEQDSAAVRRQYITAILSIHPSIDRYLAAHWARVGLDQMAPLSPGEIERISIPLGPSNKERLTGLLITYIDHFRPEGDRRRGTIYPFAPGALDTAMEFARYYPRNTLRLAHMILRQASSEKIGAPIGKAYVDGFLPKAQASLDEEDDFLIASETKLED